MSVALIIVVSIVAVIFILPRMLMAAKTAKLKGSTAPTPHKASAGRIQSGSRTVLYFYSPGCRACKMQDPVIQKLIKKHPKAIFKIDATQEQASAAAYGVMGVPFVVFIDKSKVVNAKAGVQLESTISDFLTE